MSKRKSIERMKAVLGIPEDTIISKNKLRIEYNRWNSVHNGPKPKQRKDKQTLSLKCGKSYLFKTDSGAYLEGQVLSDNEVYIIRLNKPEPNLLRIKKGFVTGVRSLLASVIPPPIEPQNSLQDTPDQPDNR